MIEDEYEGEEKLTFEERFEISYFRDRKVLEDVSCRTAAWFWYSLELVERPVNLIIGGNDLIRLNNQFEILLTIKPQKNKLHSVTIYGDVNKYISLQNYFIKYSRNVNIAYDKHKAHEIGTGNSKRGIYNLHCPMFQSKSRIITLNPIPHENMFRSTAR